MTVFFKKIKDRTQLLNPFKGFEVDEIPFEIRTDPLTGQSVRIFDLPYRPVARPDLDDLIRRSKEMHCPFCPESLEGATPLYPEELVPGGRIRQGDAWLFPNLLPLDRYASVCVIGRDHFVAPGDFTPEIMKDAFGAARTFIHRVARKDPAVRFFNINWNYMPPSGSSMIHPHLQVNCGPIPTYHPGLQARSSYAYFVKNGTTFWEDYMDAERASGERLLMESGLTFWTMSFAPLGALPDIWCIFKGCRTLVEWTDDDQGAFLKGLTAALRYFDHEGLYSFNVSLFSGPGDDHFRINARITPRMLLREIGNSDQTYYQVLHREPTCIRPPESVRDQVRAVFEKILLPE